MRFFPSFKYITVFFISILAINILTASTIDNCSQPSNTAHFTNQDVCNRLLQNINLTHAQQYDWVDDNQQREFLRNLYEPFFLAFSSPEYQETKLTPLHECCIDGDITHAKALLSESIEIDALSAYTFLERVTFYNLTAAHLAALAGHSDLVRLLVVHGADLSKPILCSRHTQHTMSILAMVQSNGNTMMEQVLLECCPMLLTNTTAHHHSQADSTWLNAYKPHYSVTPKTIQHTDINNMPSLSVDPAVLTLNKKNDNVRADVLCLFDVITAYQDASVQDEVESKSASIQPFPIE